MAEFFMYIVKGTICTGILFLYYYFSLRDKTMHRFNRYYLLFSVAAGLTMPLINIPISWENAATKASLYFQTLDVIQIGVSNTDSSANVYVYLFTAYVIISVVILAKLVNSVRRIVHLRRKYHPVIVENVYLYETEERDAPFSFMNNIFWNRSISKHSDKGVQILRHELYHVKEKHSLDLLFMNIVISLAWINPFLYLVRRELRTVHEYLADEFAVSGGDEREYASLLVNNAIAQQRQKPLTHSFFHSPLKRRITMILQQPTKGSGRLQRLLAFPLIIALFCCFAFRPGLSGRSGVAGTHAESSDTVKEPSFKGGPAAWADFLVKNLKYPKTAEEQKRTGNVIVTFSVNVDGTVSGEAVTSDPGYGMGEEALRVIRLSSGKWEPATENGSAVKAQKSQPFAFRLNP